MNNFNKLNENNKIIETNKSHKNIIPIINSIDKKIKLSYNNSNNTYYRYLKQPKKTTKYGYCTIIFCDSKYISSILATGFYLKNIIKTKYDIICLVQDNQYHEGNNITFDGITSDEIEDIKKIYDVVIGIDLIRIGGKRKGWDFLPQYKNLPYYSTKLLCLGLTEYSKIIYYDSTSLIIENIDYLFDKYNKSTYRPNYSSLLNRGLVGNFYFFIPDKYYIYKGLYLVKNYNIIFKNFKSLFTRDEDIVFYTIFPNWNNTTLDSNLFKDNYKRYPYYNIDKNIETKNSKINILDYYSFESLINYNLLIYNYIHFDVQV